jgi:hypothetical protein
MNWPVVGAVIVSDGQFDPHGGTHPNRMLTSVPEAEVLRPWPTSKPIAALPNIARL